MEQEQVIAFLANPATHHSIAPIKRIDTHGAHVFLVGNDAYKIKRAVRYPYMDFSTLARREAACKNEIAVNYDGAAGIYLAAVPVTRDGEGLHINGGGEVVEWAVHMRRFDEDATFDKMAKRGEISDEITDQLARTVSEAHARARKKSGFVASLRQIIVETTAELEVAQDGKHSGQAARLRQGMLVACDKNHALLVRRERDGKVRRCHGDLHLRNIVWHERMPLLFDAIEFDENIASIDTLYDLAFLIMDLSLGGLRDRACRLLSQYIWLSDDPIGEIESLALLPLFLALRAAIRAKVMLSLAALNADQDRGEVDRYLLAALNFLHPSVPRLVAVGGLSGTGKTRLAQALAGVIGAAPGALLLRSDIERKRLFHVPSTTPLGQNAYGPAVSRKIYKGLMLLGRVAIMGGRSVILDATFRSDQERRAAVRLSTDLAVQFCGIWLDAPAAIRLARVRDRRGDASDATAEIAARQGFGGTLPAGWTRLDASGTPEATCKIAIALLQAQRPLTTPE